MNQLDSALAVILTVVVLAILGLFARVIYQREFSDSFSLAKSGWECTESHRARVYQPVMAGKVVIPQWNVISVCDQYTRI